jgi:Na+-translocating ferredoxin:NAD+ oxidoreductase subunit B
MSDLAARIDRLLPQTQCTRCGFPGCKPYALAIAEGTAKINQCPPGGSKTIEALASLLQQKVLPLNVEHGVEKTLHLAVIDESRCIGCTLCIQVCPVDAIVGASKKLHAVIESECTGCELCVPACPVDCIELIEDAAARHPAHVQQPASDSIYGGSLLGAPVALRARMRWEQRLARKDRLASEQAERLAKRRTADVASHAEALKGDASVAKKTPAEMLAAALAKAKIKQ